MIKHKNVDGGGGIVANVATNLETLYGATVISIIRIGPGDYTIFYRERVPQ